MPGGISRRGASAARLIRVVEYFAAKDVHSFNNIITQSILTDIVVYVILLPDAIAR
jgi:hypothetical protein